MTKSKKSTFYAILSHIYEHYESSLFGFAAPFLLALFFSQDARTSRIGIYLSIAASFWMRPLGALIFSFIGDLYGRKKALTLSVLLCVIPSFLVSFLPTYDVIGIWAPFCLIVVRMAQGIGIGGGFYATLTLVSESETTEEKKNIIFGLSLSMGFLGAILGILSASFFLSSELSKESWRFPFLIGAIYGLLLFFMKRMVKESKSWENAPKLQKQVIPFLDAFLYSRRNVYAVFLLGMWLQVPFYIGTSWLPAHMVDLFHHHSSDTLAATSVIFSLCGTCTIFSCWLNTRVHIKSFMMASGFLGILASAFLFLALDRKDPCLLWYSQLIIAIYTAIIAGPSFILIQKLFPVQYKFSGFAIPFSSGQAIILGSTPLICEFILHTTHKSSNIAYLVLISVAFSIFAGLIAKPHIGDTLK